METKELKDQFQELQAQQQKKLLERRRKKELAAKNQNKNNDASQDPGGKFGVDDDLNLKLSDPSNKNFGYLSEELVDHLNVQIREMKDENGRLYKLLSERDFEIRQLKKKAEETKKPLLNETAVTNETAATKIIELSRKVRELTAEKESERTKCRQLQKKIHDIQSQSQAASSEPPSIMGSMVSLRSQIPDNRSEDSAAVDVKALQDRLKQTEIKCTDFRNQCQSLRQELKVANKVLSQEIGENVNIQSLLNETSNWRGRAQQIIALQQKVDELKVQLESQAVSETGSILGQPEKGNSGRRRQEEKYREELKRLDRERKEAQENTMARLKNLEEENKGLKDKVEAVKVRNKVLSNDIKQQKAQVQTLLKKSRNDDEFIDALMKQQGQLKQLLDDSSSQQSQQTMAAHLQLQQMSMKSQQDSNIVEQLKAIAAQKEAQVKTLEMELQNLRGAAQAKKLPANAAPTYLSSPEQSLVLDNGGDVEVEVMVSDRPFTGQSDGRRATSRNESQLSMSMAQISSRTQSRASSATVVLNSKPSDHREIAELRYKCQEVEIMCRSTEVERDKMSELVRVLQLRLAEETEKLNEANAQVQMLKRATVELEKRLAKQALDNGAKRKGTARGPAAPAGVEPEQDEEESSVEKDELLTKLEIQMDENVALKAALQRTIRAKDEDMKVYSSTLDQTKQVFLQALRQMKDKHMAEQS